MDPKELHNDAVITDLLLRITVLERLLIAKDIFTVEELSTETNAVAAQVLSKLTEQSADKN